jgi:hypothetical protein
MELFGSFLRRITRGGVLAAGIAALLATGCELAVDQEVDQVRDLGEQQTGEPLDIALEVAKGKVPVCHLTANDSFHTIVIADQAVGAHLRHGDIVGACDDVLCGGQLCMGS